MQAEVREYQNSTSTTLPLRPASVGASSVLIQSFAETSGGAAPTFRMGLPGFRTGFRGFVIGWVLSSRPSGTWETSREAGRFARATSWYMFKGSQKALNTPFLLVSPMEW